MNKWVLKGVVILLVISLAGNVWFFSESRQQLSKLNEVEALVSQSVERNIRQVMRQIDFLLETESPESYQRLQSAMEELTSSFTQWVLLSQTEERPNGRMQEALRVLEALRNTLVNQLDRHYRLQCQTLDEPDREMLRKVHDQMSRLLLIYHNIQDRLGELENPSVSDGGLTQLMDQISETVLLYRHSAIPNHHPVYLDSEEALRRAGERIAVLQPEAFYLVSKKVRIREGVHLYDAMMDLEEFQAQVGIDARDAGIRTYQMEEIPAGEAEMGMEEALEHARRSLGYLYEGRVKEEFVESQNWVDRPVYVFRFTPLAEMDVEVASDAYQITISAVTGQVVQFSNDFVGTSTPTQGVVMSADEIRQQEQPEMGRMIPGGKTVIRTFSTRYRPRLTYYFRIMRNEQPFTLYYDVVNGRLIHEQMDLFQPVQ